MYSIIFRIRGSFRTRGKQGRKNPEEESLSWEPTRACFSPVGHLMVQNFTYFPNSSNLALEASRVEQKSGREVFRQGLKFPDQSCWPWYDRFFLNKPTEPLRHPSFISSLYLVLKGLLKVSFILGAQISPSYKAQVRWSWNNKDAKLGYLLISNLIICSSGIMTNTKPYFSWTSKCSDFLRSFGIKL